MANRGLGGWTPVFSRNGWMDCGSSWCLTDYIIVTIEIYWKYQVCMAIVKKNHIRILKLWLGFENCGKVQGIRIVFLQDFEGC